MSRRAQLASVAALSAALVTGVAIVGPHAATTVEPSPSPTPTVTVTATPAPSVKTVAGSIRWQSSTAWAPINDAGHEPVGIARVDLHSTHLRVVYDEPVDKVIACSVTPDEGFTAAGVRVGASVGLTYVAIYAYMGDSSTPVSPATLSRAGANIWLDCTFVDLD